MSDIAVGNTDAQLTGKTLVVAQNDQTITGLQSFSRGGAAPFAVNAGATVVANLDADKVDGQDWTSPTIASPTLTSPVITGGTQSAPTITSPVINTSILSTKLIAGICEGRLTLTSGTAVTTADVTGATNVYFTPFKGNCVALYDGTTNWALLPFTERTLALGTLTNDLPYDVFIWNNAGTITLEALAWTNKTTRATALVLQDGVLSKTGALTRRYLGTFHTTATTTTEDSAAKRLLWNYYNRVPRQLRKTEATASWTYTTLTWRQANAGATNQVAVIVGVAENAMDLEVFGTINNSVGGAYAAVAIGEDSTTTPSTVAMGSVASGAVASNYHPSSSRLVVIPAVGYHFYAWLEISQATGSTTWYGTNGFGGGTNQSMGLIGTILA